MGIKPPHSLPNEVVPHIRTVWRLDQDAIWLVLCRLLGLMYVEECVVC